MPMILLVDMDAFFASVEQHSTRTCAGCRWWCAAIPTGAAW